jgi:dipeptidyl aminopeptidase/acylaminoacyl peptidase
MGYSPLASLETIITRLSKEGLIDPKRIGFMGQSWGGFWAEFVSAHSGLFQAFEIANGGSELEPNTYFLYPPVSAKFAEHYMGGPPYGSTMKNYLEFSPTVNAGADVPRAPFLIQTEAAEAISELELYTPLKRNGGIVEMIVYPNDGHSLAGPEHRYYSMDQNLDWFRFWLQGYEDPSPDKGEQYQRWRKFRKQKEGLLNEERSSNSSAAVNVETDSR